MIFRKNNAERIFNDGHSVYLHNCYKRLWIAANILGYRKVQLIGVSIPMQFELIINGVFSEFISESSDEKSINFISRSANNNGVAGRIILQDGMKTFNKGDITVPLGGSILSAFVQDEDFVTAQNVCVLRPIGEMSELEKWFYCYSIRENRFKFSAFGREVNKYIKEIELPEKIPDWVYSSKGNIDFNLENQLSFPLNLKKDDWIDFYIHDVFTDIESCKCSNASSLLIEGDDIEYIGAKKKNNGVMYKVQYNEDLITKGNCVIFICDGQGSVGYTNYIDHDFIGSTR